MKTINDLLKQAYQYADSTAVKLNIHVPLKKLRANAKLFSSLGVSQVTVEGAKKKEKPAAKKAKAQPKVKAAKKVAAKKSPAAKAKTTVATKKKPAAKSKTAAKKASTGRGGANMVTQEGVLAAIRDGNHTPQEIADAMNANSVQVGKALSRYTQKGIIRRTKPGHYAL